MNWLVRKRRCERFFLSLFLLLSLTSRNKRLMKYVDDPLKKKYSTNGNRLFIQISLLFLLVVSLFLFIKNESRKENWFLVNEINVVDSIDNERHLSSNDKCCSFVKKETKMFVIDVDGGSRRKKEESFRFYSNIRMWSNLIVKWWKRARWVSHCEICMKSWWLAMRRISWSL